MLNLETNTVPFIIQCSKGTYIRSIARDIGELSKCKGTLLSLNRIVSAPFSLKDAVKIEKITLDNISNYLKEFKNMPSLVVIGAQWGDEGKGN